MHSSLPPPPSAPSDVPLMAGLGQALRWLREKQARKQYRVADNAGITKGMLSAYETGRQRPSLDTLEKILETLGCDLNDLHNALQIVNGRPECIKSWRGWQTLGWPSGTGASAAYGNQSAALGGALRAPDAGGLEVCEEPAAYGAPPSVSDAETPGRHADGLLGTTPTPSPLDGPGPAGAPPSPPAPRRPAPPAGWSGDLDTLLGRDRPRLAFEEEQALSQMMDGFHSLVRYWHRSLSGLARRPGGQTGRLDRSPGS